MIHFSNKFKILLCSNYSSSSSPQPSPGAYWPGGQPVNDRCAPLKSLIGAPSTERNAPLSYICFCFYHRSLRSFFLSITHIQSKIIRSIIRLIKCLSDEVEGAPLIGISHKWGALYFAPQQAQQTGRQTGVVCFLPQSIVQA